jgi:hypothetical protein
MLDLRFSVFFGWVWPKMKIFARDKSRPPWVTANPGHRLGLRRQIQGAPWFWRDPHLGLSRPMQKGRQGLAERMVVVGTSAK